VLAISGKNETFERFLRYGRGCPSVHFLWAIAGVSMVAAS